MDSAAHIASTAWGDESVRMVGDPPFYLLGASVLSERANDGLERLVKIKPPGSKKLHWREMGQRLQRDSLRTLADIERIDIVALASPLVGHKQERARRKCLETLLPALEARGVSRLVLESRKPASDRLDLSYMDFARGKHLVTSIKLFHEDGAAEPRLWIADQVLGAMGDHIARTGNWSYWETEWEALRLSIDRIDVPL